MMSLPCELCKWVRVWDWVLPCAASGDMCWWERLWIWCLYAYTASTSTMMHPIMPPATGPTGALLIMFRDATSSSAGVREGGAGEVGTGRRRWSDNEPTLKSSGSDPESCCDADTCVASLMLSNQCEMMRRETHSYAAFLFFELLGEPKKNNLQCTQSVWSIGYQWLTIN